MASSTFRRIAVVGVGLIGGSIGLAARRRLRRSRIVGIDRVKVLRRALDRRAIREGTASLARGVRGADLIVLALPVDAILRILPRLARLAPPGAVITDVGSTKGAIHRAALRAGLRGRFVGGHPMAGSERSGVEYAAPDLFRGAPWVLCASGPGPASGRVAALVRRLGGAPFPLSPRRHDEVVARLSHLPQLVSVALVNAAARGAARRSMHLAGPAYRQMSRLASSSPRLWSGILRTNRDAVTRALADFAREIARLRPGGGAGTAARFRRAARLRALL